MEKVVFLLIISTFAANLMAGPPKVELVKGENRIDVVIGGEPFTSYLYSSDLTKPLLVPVRTPSGIEVSRRHPLTRIEGGSTDHEHHVGIFFAVDQVNGVNFWKNTSVSPQIRHMEITEMAGGTGAGKLSTVSHWMDDKRQVLLEERRTMVFLAGGHENEYAIDLSMDLTAKSPRVLFEDIEEGMFAIRVSDYLRESDPKISPQQGRPLPNESIAGTGRYFSSNGDVTAKNVWGKRARWVALQGVRQGKVVGVAILNHPAGINYPTYWHVRNYGLFSANPLGQADFQRQQPRKYRKNKIMPLRLMLEQGETAHFRFLVIVYEGFRTNLQIEERFRKFAE
ncbi:MAG TPA: PmoA family protein [Sedimentisphaerales bacterium]|nr:PmoA family protein [Sedimentisphaerales bacterium]